MSPRHGDHDPARGWYSAVTKGWHSKPDSIGRTVPAPTLTDTERGEFERWQQQANRRSFRPDPQLEQLRRLRDSDRAEERQTFQRIAAGSRRVELRDYEAARAAHLERGGEIE